MERRRKISAKKPHTFAIPLSQFTHLRVKPHIFGTMRWNGREFMLVSRKSINELQNRSRARHLKKTSHPITDAGIRFRSPRGRKKR